VEGGIAACGSLMVVKEVESVAGAIRVVRGQRVMIDSELAALYGVTTKRLNEQVKRNLLRFPVDFMFRLTAEEAEAIKSQFATLKEGRGRIASTCCTHSPSRVLCKPPTS
jgi:hypothetical protein